MMAKKKTTQAQSNTTTPKASSEIAKNNITTVITPGLKQEQPQATTPELSPQPSFSEDQEMAILTLMEMGGFDRDLVIKALKAAYNNPDRAAEYLFSGNDRLFDY